MNVKYINPLLESTINVLTTMAMVQVTPGKPSIKNNTHALGDVTGQIDLAGSQTQGSLSISFSQAAILDITKNMIGEELAQIDETVVDVVGEITNMITGSAKRLYSEQGLEFDLTRPSTFVGRDKDISHSVEGAIIVLPFSIDAGKFYLEVCFKN